MTIPGFTADTCLRAPNGSETFRSFVLAEGFRTNKTNTVDPAGDFCYPACRCRFHCYGSGLFQHCFLMCYKNCLYCEDMGGGNIRCEVFSKPCRPPIFG